MSRSHQIPSFNPFPGNTRVSFDQTGKVLQDNSYYPYCMGLGEALTHIHNTSSENKYLSNGNPDTDRGQDDFGLGWYEFSARMYDPSIGRWNGVDAHAENYFSLSTYNYGLNNLLLLIDLVCMHPKGYVIEETVAGRYGGGVYGNISGIDEFGNTSLGEKSNSNDNKNSHETKKNAYPVTTRLTSVALGKGSKNTFGSKVIAASFSRGESETSSGVAENGRGDVSRVSAYWHYDFGVGTDYHVNISNGNLSMISAKNFPEGVGSGRTIDLFAKSSLSIAGPVFGSTSFTYLGNNQVKGFDNFPAEAEPLAEKPYYDAYNYHVIWNEGFTTRNIVTGIVMLGVNMPWHQLLFNAYGGASYRFYLTGIGTIGGVN